MLDKYGYRPNVGIILINQDNKVFWGKRIREQAWQFPQGGINPEESPEQAMFRELHEEIGLHPEHVEIIGRTRNWLRYNVPERWVRREWRGHYRGQKQIWFLLRMKADDSAIALDADAHPEFDSWRWSDYWLPLDAVIEFKRGVYMRALTELSALLDLPPPPPTLMPRAPRGRGSGAARSNRAGAATSRGNERQGSDNHHDRTSPRAEAGGRAERSTRPDRAERNAPRNAEDNARRGTQPRAASGSEQRPRAAARADSASPAPRTGEAGRSAPPRRQEGRRRPGARNAQASKAARPDSAPRTDRHRSRQVTGSGAPQGEPRPTSLAEPPARPRRRARSRR